MLGLVKVGIVREDFGSLVSYLPCFWSTVSHLEEVMFKPANPLSGAIIILTYVAILADLKNWIERKKEVF